MTDILRAWVRRWTLRRAAAFAGFAVLLSFGVSYGLGQQYAQASYLFTVPAGLTLCLFNAVLAARAWRQSHILSVTAVIISIFMLAFALEEIGWAFWQQYIRPDWFTQWLSPFLKSIQSAGMSANVACLFWFFRFGDVQRLPTVALITAGLVLTFGTLAALALAFFI